MSKWTQGVGQRRLWKAEEFDGLKPTVYDWVRMAAFLDGEGNLNINPRRNRGHEVQVQVRILIGNTNPALAVWLRKTFGGNIVLRDSRRYNPNAKQTYIWSCTAARAAWVLTNCLPWFLLKGPQAEILISLQEEIDRTRQGRGRRVTDESWERRFALKDELHKLNAKGCINQIVIPVAGLTGE
jgi:hypothetical protein